VTPFADEKTRRVVVAHEEITKQKEIETALRASQARFQSMVDNLPGTVYQFALHPDGVAEIPFASGGYWELYEVNLEELQRNPRLPAETVYPADRARYESSIIE